MSELIIQICSDAVEDSDLDEATRRLRAELSLVDGCEVRQLIATSPNGAKAIDANLIGQLLLSVIGSGGIVVTLITVLRDWLTRHQDFKLRIKRGNTEIELTGKNHEELKELLKELKSLIMDIPDA